MDVGYVDRLSDDVDISSWEPTSRELARKKQQLVEHLKQIQSDFNRHAKKVGLPIRINTKGVQRRVAENPGHFKRFFNREDDKGVLHREQIFTIIECFVNMLREPDKCGLLLGALQAGKSNTIIALQWIGPINYLLDGTKQFPLYLITSQKSHEAQAREELALFIRWYGDVRLDRANRSTTLAQYRQLRLHEMFVQNPTLNTYREVVLEGEEDVVEFELDEFVNRRVHGKQVQMIADKCEAAINAGYRPLLFLDEGQFGASDRRRDEDEETLTPSVSRRIIDAVRALLGSQPRYVVASATPYEFNDADRIWVVKQYLSETYVGFNMFAGEVIADKMWGKIHTPAVVNFQEFGQVHKLPIFGSGLFSIRTWALELRYGAQKAKIRFERWRKREGYEGDYDEYCEQVEDDVRDVIYQLTAEERKPPAAIERWLRTRWPSLTDRDTIKRLVAAHSKPVGICIRLCNNNKFTDEFIARLDLDPERVEVLPFYQQFDDKGRPITLKSIKQFLRKRKRPDLPFVIFVTARARMGDAFPLNVRYFLECSTIAADLNALLQGLTGRACGYFKNTCVILSEANWHLVMEFVASNGGHIYTPSRHATVVGLRRGPFTSMLKVPSNIDDPVVRAFMQQVHQRMVVKYVKQGRSRLETIREKDKAVRYGPILEIARKLKFFDYCEQNRSVLFPSYSMPYQIPREGDQVPNRKGKMQCYDQGEPPRRGYCRFTFRNDQGLRGGVSGRGLHTTDEKRDSQTDRARVAGRLEPQINMEKFDPVTGRTINDRHLPVAARKPGNWRISMVALPLKQAVREMMVGTGTYVKETSVFDELLTDDQRRIRLTEQVHIRRSRR